MANKIILKKSSVAGRVPAVGDLDYGELALNYRDGILYYKDNSNVIQELVSPATDENVANTLVLRDSNGSFSAQRISLDDPVLTIGGVTAPASDDNKDRGIEFRWHDGTSAKLGFFGFDDSTGKFTFIPDASNASDVFSGTTGEIDAKVDWSNLLNIPSGSGNDTTYSISAETGTGGANLRLTGSDLSTDDVLVEGGTNVTVTRTDADTITISSANNTYSAGTGLTLTSGTTFDANVDGTTQSVASNAVSTETGRTYAVQVDGSDNLVVNVPWTDADTNTDTLQSIANDTANADRYITFVSNASGAQTGGSDSALRYNPSSNLLKTGAINSTGNVTFNNTNTGLIWSMNTDGASIKFYNTQDSDTDSRLEFNTSDNNNEYFRWTHSPSGGTLYEAMKLVSVSDGNSVLTVNGQYVSTITTGTAPLVVSSTTKVANLNADLLDDLDQSNFLRSNVNDNYTNGTLTFDSGTTLTAANGATVNFNNAIGTAPFTVVSTDLITNLNADLFDGLQSTEFNLDRVTDNGNTTTNAITVGELTVQGTTFSGAREEYTNSNIIRVNQRYTGNAVGATGYFEQGEYQKVVTITPDGGSQNYQVEGAYYVQSGADIQAVHFTASLRSGTLPDLVWELYYSEEHTNTRWIKPVLWTKETTTAGFVLAFEVLNGSIFGSVTADITIIPRNEADKSNITVNSTVNSEQTTIDTGFTQRDFSIRSQWNDQNLALGTVSPTAGYRLYNSGQSYQTAGTFGVDGGDRILISNRATNDVAVESFAAELFLSSGFNGMSFEGSANTTLMKMDDTGRLGIGKTAPDAKLDVVDATGSLTSTKEVTARIRRSDGTYNPRLEIRHSDIGTDINHTYTTTSNNLTFSVGNSEFMRLNSAGRLGLQNTALPVDGLTIGDGTGDNGMRIYHNDTTFADYKGWGISFNRSVNYLRPATNGDKNLEIGGSTLFWNNVIQRADAGHVFTGSTVSIQGAGASYTGEGMLHVNAGVGANGDAEVIIEADTNNLVETSNALLSFYQDDRLVEARIGLTGGTDDGATGALDNSLLIRTRQSSSGNIQFATGGAATNEASPTDPSVRMTILQNGKVGIGTNNPTIGKLEVLTSEDVVAAFGSTDNKASIRISDNDTPVFVSAENAVMSLGFNSGANASNVNIRSDGSLAVGTSANPSGKVLIDHNPGHTTGTIGLANSHLELYNSVEANTDEKGSIITFTDNYFADPNYIKTTRAAIKGGTDTVGNTANGFLAFYTDQAGANSANERMRIDSAGNVGIGVSSGISYNLEIRSSDNSPNIGLRAGDNTSTTSVYFGDTGSTTVGAINYLHTGDVMDFRVGGQSRLTIRNDGDVEVDALETEVVKSGANGSWINFDDDGGTGGFPNLNHANGSNTTTLGSVSGLNFAIDTNNNDTAEFRWFHGLTASPTEIMSLDGSGNLDVAGDFTATTLTVGTGGSLQGPSTFYIDPAPDDTGEPGGATTDTGTVVILGDLQVNGTTTTINSTNTSIADLNITLADGAANASAANGAGITIDGANATFTYDSVRDSFEVNKPFNGLNIDTNTNTDPFKISRNGSVAAELLNIGVTDNQAIFNYIEDTSNEGTGAYGSYLFQVSGNEGTSPTVGVMTLDENRLNIASDASYQIGGINVLSRSSSYTVLRDTGGGAAIYLGSTDDRNYYDADSHRFRSNDDGSQVNLAEMTETGFRLGGITPTTDLQVTSSGVNGILLDPDTSNNSVSGRLFFETTEGISGMLGVSGNLSFRRGMTVNSTSGTETMNINGTDSAVTMAGNLTVNGGTVKFNKWESNSTANDFVQWNTDNLNFETEEIRGSVIKSSRTLLNKVFFNNAIEDGGGAFDPGKLNVLAGANYRYTVAATNGGTSATISDNIFEGSSSNQQFTVANAATTEVVITITNINPQQQFTTFVGVTFGQTSYRAKDVKIETFRGSPAAWQTECDLTDQTACTVVRQVGSNDGNGVTAVRYTFKNVANVAGSYFRINNLFIADYNTSFAEGGYHVGRYHDNDIYSTSTVKDSNSLRFEDDSRIKVGTNDDLQIYHNGNDTVIGTIGAATGDLILNAGGSGILRINGTSTAEVMLKATENAGVELYHNGVQRLVTTVDGVSIVSAQNAAVTNLATSVSEAVLQINGDTGQGTDAIWAGKTQTAGRQYIQAANSAGNTAYDLLLNPHGGDVGIGTDNPISRLDVRGRITVEENAVPLMFNQADQTNGTIGKWWRMPVDGTSLRFDVSLTGDSAFTTYRDVLTLNTSGDVVAKGDLTAQGAIFRFDGNNYINMDDDTQAITTGTNATNIVSVSDIAFQSNSNDGGGGLFTFWTGSSGAGEEVATLNNATKVFTVGGVVLDNNDDTVVTTHAALRRGSAGELYADAPGHIVMNIDSNNNNTDRYFGISTDANYTAPFFTVNEDGQIATTTDNDPVALTLTRGSATTNQVAMRFIAGTQNKHFGLGTDGKLYLATSSNISVNSVDAIVQAGRAINSGTGLTGGGNLTSDRTLNIDYAGTDNFIDAATNLEGTAIATADTIVYHDATDNNVKKGLVSDLPFNNYVHPTQTAIDVNCTDNGVNVIDRIQVNTLGHVTSVTTRDLSSATASTSGVVNAGVQTFGGAKTFNSQVTVDKLITSSNTVTTELDIEITDNGNIGATQGLNFYVDVDNNATGNDFTWRSNARGTTGSTLLLTLDGDDGRLTTTGTIDVNGQIEIEDLRAMYKSSNFLYINANNDFTSGTWFGTSDIVMGNADIGVGGTGNASNSRVYIKAGGATNTGPLITIDGTDGSIQAGNITASGTITFSGLSSATEATSVMINASNELVTRELSSGAFATAYVHPAYTARSINTTGVEVIDVFESDTIGSVTNVTKRTLPSATASASGVVSTGTQIWAGNKTFNGDITAMSNQYWQVSTSDVALQRADARDDATNFARLHWYGESDTGGTSNFRHAWYDGTNYINVTATSNVLNFDVEGAGSLSIQQDGVNLVTEARSVSAGNGLTGGGTLASNRTITLGTPSTLTGATTNALTASSHTHDVRSPTTGNWHNSGFPFIATDGVMEIGEYIDFHAADTGTTDYDVRLTSTTAGTFTVSNLSSGVGLSLSTTVADFSRRVDINQDLRIRGDGSTADLGVISIKTNASNDVILDAGNNGTNLVTIDTNGLLTATSKSFDIEHPTKEGKRLRYGSLEGPENGVYVRGRLKDSRVIELPDYWTGLVHEDSITVSLTAMGRYNEIWVEKIEDNKVYVDSTYSIDCFYHVFAERKDIDPLTVEYESGDNL